MNTTMRIFTMLAIGASLGLSACSKSEPPKPLISDKGRPETRSVEALNAVGYNGTAMRQKLDKALDANDAQSKKMDQAADQ
jgi:Holliday junction resolvasome RuvABC DNA-binding subunit